MPVGSETNRMLKMQNDERTKWILSTAQAVEGLNILQQAVKTNAILTRQEVLDIIFGNIRTTYVKDLFKIMYRQSQEKSVKVFLIAIANHNDNICNSLHTIYESAKVGHIKDWGLQIRTDEKTFQHPPMKIEDVAKSTTTKIACIHVKYDGKAKQPNDPISTETKQLIQDCLVRGWISRKAQNILALYIWLAENDRMLDPFNIDDLKERLNQCLDIIRSKLEVSVYTIQRAIIINNNLIP